MVPNVLIVLAFGLWVLEAFVGLLDQQEPLVEVPLHLPLQLEGGLDIGVVLEGKPPELVFDLLLARGLGHAEELVVVSPAISEASLVIKPLLGPAAKPLERGVRRMQAEPGEKRRLLQMHFRTIIPF